MFKPGDNVLYYGEFNSHIRYKCVVIYSSKEYTRVVIKGSKEYRPNTTFGEYVFPTTLFKLDPECEIKNSKEELMIQKIKYLWNKSNYVKKNPLLAMKEN